MLRPVSIFASIAMLAAFCDAPFVHIHGHPNSEHARAAHDGGGPAGHTHWIAPHAGAGPELRAHDDGDDAVFLTWLQSTPQAKPVVIPLQPAPPVLAALFVAVCYLRLASPRSHDPPPFSRILPRSPPSLPSPGA